MLGQLREYLQRFNPQSDSVRNVLKLAGGTAGSQVITVAAAPVLTRLYGPESFGVLATFTSILVMLNVVSSLRYELAIAVPEDDDEAIALVWLCFVLVAITTALTALGVALLGNQLVNWLQQPKLKPLLWLLPVGVLLMGVYQPLSYWAIRRKQFGMLAQIKFRQSTLAVASSIAAAPLGSIGLLLGQIVNQSAGISKLLNDAHRPSNFLRATSQALISFRELGAISAFSGLIEVIGWQAPILLIASSYSTLEVGAFSVALRIALLPASLAALSTSQVFLQRIATAKKPSEAAILFTSATHNLCKLGLLSCFILSLASPALPLVFGQRWQKGSELLLCMIPLLFSQIALIPLGVAFEAREKMKEGLAAQIQLTVFKIVPLFLLLKNFEVSISMAVLSYSLSIGLGSLNYFLILRNTFKLQSGSQAQ